MNKKYIVVVSSKVWVVVEGKLAEEDGKEKPFKFSLQCERLDAAALKEEFANTEETAADMIKKITFGWKDQRLVLEEDGSTPAEFSPDALSALLGISGMGLHCLNAYVKAASVKAKN